MKFIARLEEALQHAEGQRIESDAIVAESFANCVADNELQKLCPPARLSDARNKLLQTKSFDNLVQSYDLPPLIAGDVLQLALFDAVLLVDDCSSMNEGTKWSDVKCIVEQVVDMVSQCNSSGLRVEFVHRNARALGVTSSRDLQLLFDGMQPQGSTPLIKPACCQSSWPVLRVLPPPLAGGATLEKLAVAYARETTFYYMIATSAGRMRACKQGGHRSTARGRVRSCNSRRSVCEGGRRVCGE
jgi:hypothetical protein